MAEDQTPRTTDPSSVQWTIDGRWHRTRIEVGPEAAVPGTDRPITGVLFGQSDVLIGSPPSGPMNPTIDLQLRVLGRPRVGTLHARGRTLRLGRTLYVGEVELRQAPDDDLPVAVAVATFMNAPLPFPERGAAAAARDQAEGGRDASLVALSAATRVAPGTFHLVADLDTVQGTVPGATLGRLAEMAALDVCGAGDHDGAPLVATELEVRFLHKVKVGPVQAEATVLGRRGPHTTVRVELTDHADGRLVSYALVGCQPLEG